jgi:hypothetical protein
MRTSVATRLVLCLLVLAGLGLAEVASAQCYGQCVVVAPPFCRRCLESDTPTGVLCSDSGSCGCFYIQCATQQAEQPETQKALTELGLGAPLIAPASCLSAPAAVVPPLAPAG